MNYSRKFTVGHNREGVYILAESKLFNDAGELYKTYQELFPIDEINIQRTVDALLNNLKGYLELKENTTVGEYT